MTDMIRGGEKDESNRRRPLLRRRLLAGVVAGAVGTVAGCSGDGDGGSDGGSDPATTEETTSQESTETPEETTSQESTETPEETTNAEGGTSGISDELMYTIPGGEFRSRLFTLNQAVTIQWEGVVKSGPAVDIVLMSQSEYERYENGEEFQYNSEGSELDTTGGFALTVLEPGDYALVVDNTNALEASPPTNADNNTAEVEVSITAE